MDGLDMGLDVAAGAEEGGALLGELGGEIETEGATGETEGGDVEAEGAAGETEGAAGETEGGAEDAAQATARTDKTRAEVLRFLREGRSDEQLKPVYDALSKAWYRDQEYAALGDVKDLRSLKEQIDILGGPEAVGRLRDLETSVETIDRMVDDGDPQVIKDMFTESPTGMKKLVPAALDQLRALDPQAYAEALTPHLTQALAATGLEESIASARELIDQAYGAKDPEYARFYMEKAFRQVTAVQSWLGGLEKQAKGDGAGIRSAAGTAAPTGQEGGRAAVPAASSPELAMRVQSQLVPWAKSEIDKALRPLMGATRMDAARMTDMVSLIAAEIDRRLSADATFQQNLSAWQRTGKLDRIVAQSKAGIGSVLAASARAVWERHGNTGARGTANRHVAGNAARETTRTETQARNRTPILVTRRPADGDFAGDQDMMDVMIRQQGRLKDGRVVRWKG